MFQLTVCRQCRGAVYLAGSELGAYLECGRCGFLCDLVEESPALRELHSDYLSDTVEQSPALLTLLTLCQYHDVVGLRHERHREVTQRRATQSLATISSK